MHVLILGASGGCGRWICRLARERGHAVRAVVRPSTPFDPPAGTDVVRAEVLEPGVLDGAASGQDAVLSALGIQRASVIPWARVVSPPDLTERVARQMVEVLPRHGVRRVVAISAGGVGESRGRTNALMRGVIASSNVGVAYRDLERMEATLAASDLDWMAVRPTTLTNGLPTGRARRVERYGLLSRIARADVAAFMLDAIEADAPFADRTPMIAG
ncbi:MAG: NAD(P)H-binding protein [Bacteroidota bacterium]